MKILNKLTILILSVAMLVSTLLCFTSCKNNESNSESNKSITETNIDLIKDGSSQYKIVISTSPETYEKHAATELKDNVFKASSVQLPIVDESQVSISADSKLLIIGETELASAAGIKADKAKFGARGFLIQTKDTNVYLIGGDQSGTLYAVYEFLHYQFGYEPYAEDEIALEQGVENKKLLNFENWEEIPDIPYVQAIGKYYRDRNAIAGHRMRYNTMNEIFVNATSQPWHNSTVIINPNEYEDTHPKWFVSQPNDSGGLDYQLHYTAHGDEVELEALQHTLFEKLVEYIERDFEDGKYYEYIGFTAQDNYLWPSSDGDFLADNTLNKGKDLSQEEMLKNDSVELLRAKYGSASSAAMLIHFINPVADKIKKYMQDNHNGRNMNITIFAYYSAEYAPVKTVDGKSVPIDDTVKCHDNVNVLLAPIRTDFSRDYEETAWAATMEQWSALTNNLSIWTYDFYTQKYVLYLDSTDSLQTFYQAAKEYGVKYFFQESGIDTHAGLPFGQLKLYLTSKLTWDTEQNAEELTLAFFKNYYKEASETMYKYYEELKTYSAYLKYTLKYSGVCSSNTDKANFWTEGVVVGFKAYFDQAYKDIEPVKEVDLATYNKLSERLLKDSLMYRYLLLKHHGKYYSQDEFNKEVAQFKADCAYLKVDSMGYEAIKDISFVR